MTGVVLALGQDDVAATLVSAPPFEHLLEIPVQAGIPGGIASLLVGFVLHLLEGLVIDAETDTGLARRDLDLDLLDGEDEMVFDVDAEGGPGKGDGDHSFVFPLTEAAAKVAISLGL